MLDKNSQASAIKSYLLNNIPQHPSDIVTVAAEKFQVTRTTIHRHLKKLLSEQHIVKSGITRDIKYFTAASIARQLSYDINQKLSEFDVLVRDFDIVFSKFPENVANLLSYGFTEIFNNAIDHSKGSKIVVSTYFEKNMLSLEIADNGIGIFKKIYDYFNLDDMRESILQLNKGKMTTDPTRHTGEGLFFSARAFDVFEIYANKIHYLRDNCENDWSIETLSRMVPGSRVIMSIRKDSASDIYEIFKKFQNSESLAFDKTEILVALSKLGEERLISRSQAKRITRDLEKFSHVTLDFSGIKLVGQGFVDEIFRVYANKHPNMNIQYIHASEDVTFMIKRGLATHRG